MSEMQRRILMTLVGVLLGGFSVGLFNQSAFGMDPFQVFAHGIWTLTPLGFGTFYMLLNLAMLVLMFFINRQKIGITTFINIFLLGYVVEYSSKLLHMIWPEPSLLVRVIMLTVGIVVICFTAALYFVGDLGVSTYDVIAITLGDRTREPFKYWRIITDVICTVIGVLFGQILGVGTVVTAFFMGPLIAFFRDKVAIPFRYGMSAAQLAAKAGPTGGSTDV